MKFNVVYGNIVNQLNTLAGIAGSSPNKDDITQNILINVTGNELSLKATNYNIELQSVIALDTVFTEGEITVNAVKLKDVLGNLDKNSVVEFNLDEEKNLLILSCDSSTFEIRTRSAIDFPSFEMDNPTHTLVLKQKQLKSIIQSSIFCVSIEDFRDYFKGIRLEVNSSKLEAFASDGHRMAILETTLENVQAGQEPFGVILTRQCASQLADIVGAESESDVSLAFTKDAVQTSCNNYKLTSKLINCGYPNVRTVIPKTIEKQVSIPNAQLVSKIKIASSLSSKRINGVTFNFGNGEVVMHSENSEHEVSQARLPLPDAVDNIEISLNAQYVRDVLTNIKCDNVLFCFTQPMIHVLIKPEVETNDFGIKASYIISKVVV